MNFPIYWLYEICSSRNEHRYRSVYYTGHIGQLDIFEKHQASYPPSTVFVTMFNFILVIRKATSFTIPEQESRDLHTLPHPWSSQGIPHISPCSSHLRFLCLFYPCQLLGLFELAHVHLFLEGIHCQWKYFIWQLQEDFLFIWLF